MESCISKAFCFFTGIYALSFVSPFLPSIRVSHTVACVTRLGLLALGGLRFVENGY